MTAQSLGFSVEATMATPWFAESSKWASSMTKDVIANFDESSVALVLSSGHVDAKRLSEFSEGQGLSATDSMIVAANFLGRMSQIGVEVLVVEDDLRRKTLSGIECQTLLIEDHIYHWVKLDEQTDNATRLLSRGSSGYPLNAFICSAKSMYEMGRLRSELAVASVIHSAEAVIVSCYDDETYLALVKSDAARRVLV
jgi:hypothetical protein